MHSMNRPSPSHLGTPVIDAVGRILRSQDTEGDIARVITYALCAMTLDYDGTLRATALMPADCDQATIDNLRNECETLLQFD
jgi:hypothetical protein